MTDHPSHQPPPDGVWFTPHSAEEDQAKAQIRDAVHYEDCYLLVPSTDTTIESLDTRLVVFVMRGHRPTIIPGVTVPTLASFALTGQEMDELLFGLAHVWNRIKNGGSDG